MTRRLLCVLALGTLSVPSTSCESPEALALPTHSEVDPVDSLRDRLYLEEIQLADSTTVVHLPARVEVPDAARHMVRPRLEGVLESIEVELGQEVRAGDVLGVVRSPQLTAMGAEELEASLVSRARRDYADAIAPYVESGFQAATPLFEAERDVAEADASTARARQIRTASTGWLGDFDANGGWMWLVPVDGVITASNCYPEARVSPEDECFEILETRRAEVVVDIPERHLGGLDHTTELRFHPANGAEPTTLAFSRWAPELDDHTRTRSAYFAPLARNTPVGSSGRGEVISPSAAPLFRVPDHSVVEFEGREVVFVETGDSALPVPVAVDVAGSIDGDLALRSAQLSAGNRIVTRGVFLLESYLLLGSES